MQCSCCKNYFQNNNIWADKNLTKICNQCYNIMIKKDQYTKLKTMFNYIENFSYASLLPPKFITHLQQQTTHHNHISTEEKQNIITMSNHIFTNDLFQMSPIKVMIKMKNDNNEKMTINQLKYYQTKYNEILNNILKCTICYEVYNTKIKTLQCGHKMCLKCYQNYKIITQRQDKMICHICRENNYESDESIEDKCVNSLIEEMLKCGLLPTSMMYPPLHCADEMHILSSFKTLPKERKDKMMKKITIISDFINPGMK